MMCNSSLVLKYNKTERVQRRIQQKQKKVSHLFIMYNKNLISEPISKYLYLSVQSIVCCTLVKSKIII